MQSDVLRLYKSVHTWTGIIAGLVLFIAFYAGAITMFKEPLSQWVAPPSVGAQAVSLGDAPRLIEQTLAAHPAAAREFTLQLRDTESVPARLTWIERSPAGEGAAPTLTHWSASLAADGSLVATPQQPPGLARFIDVLHRTGSLPVDLHEGMLFMGIVSMLYALALVSGVIVLLPTLVADLFALRLGRNLKRQWLDAHNVIGIASLPFHIIMAVSAVVFGFHDQIYDSLEKAAYGGQQSLAMADYARPSQAGKPAGVAAAMISPEALLRRVREKSPGIEPVSMVYQHAGDSVARVIVIGEDPRYMLRKSASAVLGATDGRFINTAALPEQRNVWTRLVNAFFSLHFGAYGGEPVRWGYFFLGLAGAFLFYSGNLLWIESRRKAERKGDLPVAQRRNTLVMAAATVGICLGCVSGISLSIVAGKWLHGWVTDINAWHQYVYYGVFLISLVVAFLRGAARASVDLLWLAAVSAFAIPMTTVLAWAVPALGMWAYGSIASVGVDIGAFIGGLCFVWMACATRRRVRLGATDSVWSTAKPVDG